MEVMDVGNKLAVSHRALLQRCNRVLKAKSQQLKRNAPDARNFNELGLYFIVDLERGRIARKKVDLEKLGNELGVLANFEKLEEEQI
jgi:hypothetical protein